MREFFNEIVSSIRQNKLRTCLTGFSVAWGIFMLIILLGSGNGLKHGVNQNFEGMNNNYVSMYANQTSKSYAGYQKGRKIRFKEDDIDFLLSNIENVADVNGSVYTSGNVNYGNTFSLMNVNGVLPAALKYKNLKLTKGRFLNQADDKERRKVIVIDENAADMFFEKKEPVGKSITVDSVLYTVIGVVNVRWGGGNNFFGYIPMHTLVDVYKSKEDLYEIQLEILGVKSVEESEQLNDKIRAKISEKLKFAPDDKSAVYMWSTIESYLNTQMVMGGITMFLWIIGLGTLMAGIVGVSNIMLVTVRERTNEFGVRKSMGATPGSLVRLVLAESIAITTVFGYIGMFLGIAAMEIFNIVYERNFVNENPNMPVVFKDPTLDITVVISATIVLIAAGVLAGFVPARRAARLKTIDAMRYNK